MKTIDKKAALADYRKRKVVAGIYALCCKETDRKWVGYTPDLSTVQNRLRFMLSTGSHPSKDLQTAWSSHGSGELAFETLERFDADELPAGAALQARLAQWRGELNAQTV